MYCKKCGVKNNDTAKFCCNCGSLLSTEEEHVLFEKKANLFRGIESVGGKILFYKDKMVFKSHSFNIQTGDTIIVYSQIQSMKKVNTIGLVPNGLLITLQDGQQHKFVVYNRSEIIDFLSKRA